MPGGPGDQEPLERGQKEVLRDPLREGLCGSGWRCCGPPAGGGGQPGEPGRPGRSLGVGRSQRGDEVHSAARPAGLQEQEAENALLQPQGAGLCSPRPGEVQAGPRSCPHMELGLAQLEGRGSCSAAKGLGLRLLPRAAPRPGAQAAQPVSSPPARPAPSSLDLPSCLSPRQPRQSAT